MQGAPASLAALLAGAIDYAGLFPPASLAIDTTAAQYDRHLAGPHRGLLGRLIVPAARLDELAAAAAALPAQPGAGDTPERWPLSVLASPPLDAAIERVRRLTERYADAAGWRARVVAIEVKAATPDEVRAAAREANGIELVVEVPVHPVPLAMLEAVREAGGRAKVRTGGVTPEAFPSADHLAAWISYCAGLGVPFKATAGLHHPIRAEHPLGAGEAAPRATMHGFVNLLAASALLRHGRIDVRSAAVLLDERDAAAFLFDDERAAWSGSMVTTAELAAARSFVLGFGSCSFDESVEGLAALGLLAAAPPAS